MDAVEDTAASEDTVTGVTLAVRDAEETAPSVEVVRGVVLPEGIVEKEVASVVDVTKVLVSLDTFKEVLLPKKVVT